MSSLSGTGVLLRAALRRERVRLPISVVVIGLLAGIVIASIDGLYNTAQERADAASFNATNVVARAFNGPASGDALGALAFHETFILLSVFTAILAVMTVVRHTRLEEDTGRAELVGAAAVGRRAPLAAAVIVAMFMSLGAGLAYTGAFVASGLSGGGAFSAGAALAAVALVAVGIGAVTAQVSAAARTASGIAIAVIGVAFVLRVLGDAAGQVSREGWLDSAWPSWLSPIGWSQQVRPYGSDDVTVLVLSIATFMVLVALAFTLAERRDLGSGLVPPRPGSAGAGPLLTGASGLAWRLQRGSIIAWVAGLTVLAGAFGGLGEEAEGALLDNPQLADILGAAGAEQLLDQFFAFVVALLAVGAAGAIVQSTLRLRHEEMHGRLDSLLATALSRRRLLAGNAMVAAATAVVVLLGIGLGGAAAFAAVTSDLSRGVTTFLLGALAHLPAVLVIGAITLALVALAPRIAGVVGWFMVAAVFALTMFADALELEGWLAGMSPMWHTPAVGTDTFTVAPLIVLTLLAAGFGAVAMIAFRRRDLVSAA